MRRAGAAAAVVVTAAVVAAAAVRGGGDPPAAASEAAGTATAAVERRDVVDRELVAGTLGYAGAGSVLAASPGTITRLRAEGAVIRRGGWLYELDGARTGWLLYGARPAWRDFAPGMADGEDVRQLEANLRALGCDPDDRMDVDDRWDWATSAAVVRFQRRRDLAQDATLSAGEIVFRPGAARIGEPERTVGDRVGSGTPVQAVSSTRREVSVDLQADRQGLARTGARVTVALPGGTARGRIVEVGKVARRADEDGAATIVVRIGLAGRGGAAGGLDQAPVDVGFERERARAALTVPVTALLARAGGGYAVEIGGRLVPVRVRLVADGLAAVRGDLREGQRVAVPA